MRTSELINQLLDLTIPNDMVREIIRDSIALHSHSNDPIVILQQDIGDDLLEGAKQAFYLPNTTLRGRVMTADEVKEYELRRRVVDTEEPEDNDVSPVQPCIVLWPKG